MSVIAHHETNAAVPGKAPRQGSFAPSEALQQAQDNLALSLRLTARFTARLAHCFAVFKADGVGRQSFDIHLSQHCFGLLLAILA